jgi:flagellar hook-associated protein FlgK
MSLGFNTALSALTAARIALETVGHNIANANTEGYSRQRVLMSAFLPQSIGRGMAIGSGVGVDAIDQILDPILTTRLRKQTQELGRAGGLLDVHRDLEAAFGEPSDAGLNARFSSFFSALTGLQATPGDRAARTGVVQSAATLAQTFRTIASELGEVSDTVEKAIEYEVNHVNKIIEDLAELNHSVVVSGFGGNVPPDVKDRQNQLLTELARSVDVKVSVTPTGQLSVTSAGQVLVDPNGSNPLRMLPKQITGEAIKLRSGSGTADYVPKTGRLSSLLEAAPATASDARKALDEVARGLIRTVNHAHATGVPPSGGYSSVVSLHAFEDVDLDGNILGEKLTDVGLPFEIENGYLTVSVHDAAGNVKQTRLGIVPTQMTVQDLVTVIDSVEHLSATVDSTGRLRIASDVGTKFEFSNSLNPTPDAAGTFGGSRPTLVPAMTFPSAIPPGLTFTLQVDGGPPQTVTFSPSQFANPAAATAQETAAAINSQVTGATASVVNGRLVLQGSTVGSSGSLKFNNGVTVVGQDVPVTVRVTGSYTGAADQSYFITPASDGVIGQTPGLKATISLADGTPVGTVDIGAGYTPGEPIEVRDGIKISFTSGAVSQAAGQFVQIDAIAESDQSGILVATGVNALFDGHDAATIAAREELLDDPDLLATSLGGGPADGANIARMILARTKGIDSLGGKSFVERFDMLIQDTGASTERAQSTFDTQQLLLSQLEARRQAVSGVNIDEELLLMEQFQRSFEVATRFTQTLAEINQTLVELGR